MQGTTKTQRLTIEQRIQALAQELQDLIFDFTVATDSPAVIALTYTHKPPLYLQINRKIRRESEKAYYFNAIITSEYPELLHKFIESLESRNRRRLYQVRLCGSRQDHAAAEWQASTSGGHYHMVCGERYHASPS